MRKGLSGVLALGCVLSLATASWAQESEEPPEEVPAEPTPAPEPAADEPTPAGEPAPGEPAPNVPAPPDGVPGALPDVPGDAAPTPEPAATDFPPEVTAILPLELLRELPAALLRYLSVEDYQRFRALCPADADGEALGKCLTSEASLDGLTRLYLRSVIRTVLSQMDAGLPQLLTDADIDEVTDACAAAVAPWADCTLEKGPDHDDCAAAEDTLALCIGDDEDVNTVYLKVQDEKKAAWGDAEQYTELRGLLSYFDLAGVKTVRAACGQTDDAALVECLQAQELTAPLMKEFGEATAGLVTEAVTELQAAGQTVDAAQVEGWTARTLTLLLTFPSRAVVSIANDCQKKFPELEKLKTAADFDKALSCIEEGSGTDPVANPMFVKPEQLKGWLAKGRAKVEAAVRTKEAAAQGKSFNLVLMVLGGAAGLGALIVLLLPIFLKKKYPNAKGLWGSSALAAGVLVVSLAVLGGALLVMRTVQAKVGTDTTSPKMRVADAAFSVLERDEYVTFFSDLSKVRLDLAKTPLRELAADLQAVEGMDAEGRSEAIAAVLGLHWAKLLEQPEIARLAKNVGTLKAQVGVYKDLIGLVKSLDSVMGYVPIVLALVAVLLYLLPLRQTLAFIASAPARAARGEASDTKEGMRAVLGELKALGPYLLLVLLLLPLTGLFIAVAVEPVMEIVINVALLNFFYLLGAEASGFALQASIIGGLVLLVLTIAAYILAVVFFAGTFRKIMRAHFHEGTPLAAYKTFWTRGSLSLLLVLAFPAAFALLARFAQTVMLEGDKDELSALDLWLVPLGSVLAFVVLFWAVRGLKAIKVMKTVPSVA